MARQYGSPKDPRFAKNADDVSYAVRKDIQPEPKEQDPSPPAIDVERFHKNAAIDSRSEDIHHTLGSSPGQASPGDHSHNGGDSQLLLEGYTLTGSKANPMTVLPSLINCLVRLGARDSTT